MDILETLKSRRSVKAYNSDAVEKADLEKIIEAGLYSASGMNRQPTKIICITDKQTRDTFAKLNANVMGRDGFDPFYNAPVVLAVLADSSANTYLEDGSLVMGNMMNEAHSLGLGSCWIHRGKEVFETPEGIALKKEFDIPESYKGIAFLIVGYASQEMKVTPRKENRVYYK